MIGLGLSITQLAVRQMLGGPVGYDPIQDFANGEQGFIYDISDLSTLFQDTAGTIPAVVGLSVARINDKSGNGNHAIQVTPTSRAILRFVDGKYRIQTDGTDDWYVTPTITPGTDKVQVFAGIRKLGDATAMIAELGINGSSFPGCFYLASGATSGTYSAYSRGSLFVTLQAQTTGSFLAPDTAVLFASGDIAGDMTTIARNGVSGTPNTANQGSGNYLTNPIYLFRRAGTSLPFNGMISSMVLRFGPNLTPEQIANMNAWTNERAGAYL